MHLLLVLHADKKFVKLLTKWKMQTYRIKLKSILIIKMIISVMKIDDYGDENDQKQTNTMPFKSKYTPLRHNYLVKKRTKSTGQGSTPTPPQTGNAHLNEFFFVDVVPKDLV